MGVRHQERYHLRLILKLIEGLKCNTEATKFAEAEASSICASWNHEQWDELDWSRTRELTTRDALELRRREGVKVQEAYACDCPNFLRHVSHSQRSAGLLALIGKAVFHAPR